MTTERHHFTFKPYAALVALGLAAASAGVLAPMADAACTTTQTVRQGGGGNCTSIQQCVDAVPGSAFTGDYCINVDSSTYGEQVVIAAKNPAGFRLIIQTDPALISTFTTVNPPNASMAAFVVKNSSVSLLNMMVVATSPSSYGVLASSDNVALSSFSVVDLGGNITAAGVALSNGSVLSYSKISVQNAVGLSLAGTSKNTISYSTITNSSSNAALNLSAASSNTITQTYISNPAGYGASLVDAGHNTISQCRILNNTTASPSLYVSATGPNKAVYNLISQSFISNPSGHAGMISFGADHNDVFQSTFASGAAAYRALEINRVSSTTVTQSFISNPAGYGLLVSFSTAAFISKSTMTGGLFGLFVDISTGVTAVDSYFQGATAGYIRYSTNTVIIKGDFNAGAAGRGLRMDTGNVNISVSSSIIRGSPSGDRLELNAGSMGFLKFSSITVIGAQNYGFNIDAQAPGAVLTVNAMTFQSIGAGASAIYFMGGTFVSTFSGVNFAGGAFNVNGSALAAGSRITMRGEAGPRAGPPFENDPSSRVDWPDYTGSDGAISPLAYTSVYANGLTANWSTTFPGGTVYYLQISTDGFATVNANNTTTNVNFAYTGLIPSTSYNVRLSTMGSGLGATVLGNIATPAAGGGTVNFNFNNGSGGAVIASGNGENEAGTNVIIDKISGGGPYAYVLFESTSGATGERPSFHGVAKYGNSGALISSAALSGADSRGAMALDNAGNLYIAEVNGAAGTRWISKYAPNLVPLLSMPVPAANVGSINGMVSDGTFLYVVADGGADNTAKLIKYNSSLVAVATAAYAIGGNLVLGNAVAIDAGSGDLYVAASSNTAGAPIHLLKYPTAFNGASPVFDVIVPGLFGSQFASLAVTGGKVVAAFPNGAGTSYILRQFDLSLNYAGVSSTMTGLSLNAGGGVQAGPNGSVFAWGTLNGGDGGDYLVMKYNANNNLAFVSSAVFNSATFLYDRARGLAVLSSTEVYITGSSSNTIADANAVTTRLFLDAGAGGAGAFFAAAPTGISTAGFTANWTTTFPGGTVYTALLSSNGFTTIASTITTTGLSATFAGLSPGTAYTAVLSTTGGFAGGLAVANVTTLSAAATSISGTLSYGGLGQGVIRVEAFANSAYSGVAVASQVLSNSPSQSYYLILGAGAYYLRAYVDALGGAVIQSWSESGTLGPITIAASSVTGQNFSIIVDSLAPNSPVGLSASPGAGQIFLTWAAPATSVNGAALQDLRGYIVQRSTGAAYVNLAGSPASPLPSANLTFTDFSPMPSVTNTYRVIAVDFAQNQSAPSPPVAVAPGAASVGGMVYGRISTFTATTSGIFRVRLSNAPGGATLAESNQNPYSFSGLSSGTYYLSGFRDLDNNNVRDSLEPAGTFGGLQNNPFPVYISGGNSVLADVTLCDRALLQVGPQVNATLSTAGCPALDAGPNRFTNPLVFEAGTGSAGSVVLNSPLIINMSRLNTGSSFLDSQLIVLGPGGQIVASNSSPGAGAFVSFVPTQAGAYLVEPTSFLSFSTGAYTLKMSSASSGSDPGQISGTLSYGGAQGGAFVVRFFDNSSFAGIPLATQAVAAAAGPINIAFNKVSLPLGTYFIDAFRDTTGSGWFNAGYQAHGQCNSGAAVTLTGGVPVVAIGTCIVSDPSASTGGSGSIGGSVSYNGALTGTIRTFLFPLGYDTPAGSVSAPAFNFVSLASGTYLLKSFLDGNANYVPDASEPVAFSAAAGVVLPTGGTLSGQNLVLCDRSPIVSGAPITASLTSADCPAPDRGGAFMRMYTFQGASGQPVSIEAVAGGFYGTFLALYDGEGNLIAADDGSGNGGNAKLSGFVLPAAGLYTIAASPYAANVTGQITLSLIGSGGALGSISGAVNYTGSQGGRLVSALFNSPLFSSATFVDSVWVSSVSTFEFNDLATETTYYLGAFVDVNFNDNPDPGEDKGLFGINGAPEPVLLFSGQNLGGVNIVVAPSTTASSGAAFIAGDIGYSGGQYLASSGQLRVEFWADSLFQSYPVAIRTLPNGTTPYAYDVSVPGGQSYFIRAFLDDDNDSIPDPNEPKGVYSPNNQGAEPLYVPASGNISGVDFSIKDPGQAAGGAGLSGEGVATLLPATVFAGQVFNATVTYTAGARGIQTGGRIAVALPPGFAPPPVSYITATSTSAGTSLTLSMAGPAAIVTLSTTSGSGLLPGQEVKFVFSQAYAPCMISTQTFSVAAAQNGAVAPQPLFSGSPALRVVQGAPAFFAPANPYFSLAQNQLSSLQRLEARDNCGNPTAVTGAPVAVALRAKSYDYQTGQFMQDNGVGLTASPAISTAATLALNFAVGQSSGGFYALSASTGFKNVELFYTLGAEATFYYGFNVLPGNALTNVSVSTATSAVGRSSATISLNPAFVNFTLGDANQPWHVAISSVPFRDGVWTNPLWETWGYGQPSLGQVSWDGRFSPWINGGGRVPSGLYYVRVEVGGSGVHDDTVQILVNAPQLAGRFYDAGVTPNPPLGSARLQIFGPSGALYAQTDSQGRYVLPGIGAGVYNMIVSRADYLDGNLSLTVGAGGGVSTFTALTDAVSASTNAASGLDVRMNSASILLVAPTLVGFSTQAFDQWGGLQVRPASTSAAKAPIFGPLRLAAGTTTFDDGGQWDPSSQQFVARTQLKFNLAVGSYTVEASFGGFAVSSASVFVGRGVTTLNLPAFTRKSSVSGLVSVPTNLEGAYVSVNAVPLSSSTLVSGGFGGVYLPPGQLSGAYMVPNLDGGSYLLRANTMGFSATSTGPVIVPAFSQVSGVDFPAFAAGASINGTVTVNADTTGRNISLSVNAWAPGSLNFGSTVVFVTGGASGLTISYLIKGLDAGATYQIFANLIGAEDKNLNIVQGQPMLQPAPGTRNFSFVASSGVISGTILLPSGATDFLNVSLYGQTVASARPDDIGHQFSVLSSTDLPGFICTASGLGAPTGFCPAGNSSATFTVQGLNTETDDITMLYATTGQTKKIRISVTDGSTTTVTVDLRSQTYSISGEINNQITSALFNTNAGIAANAPFIAPAGYPAGLSSTTARIVAVAQDIAQYRVAVSTIFNPAVSRIGFLSAAGTYTITGLPAGIYLVRTVDLRACATCPILAPSVGQIVNVAGVNLSSVNFTLSDGHSVAGSVSLDADLLDSQVFTLSVLNRRQEIVRSTSVFLGDANSGLAANAVSYDFNNLPANDFYTLVAASLDGKYVGAPILFPDPGLSPSGLQSDLTDQNIVMKRAAFFTGKLKDAGTGDLITANNAAMLAPNFLISATATPWTPGGYSLAVSSVAGRPILADGTFRLGPALPGVSYRVKLAQTNWDPAFLSRGSQNYAPVTIAAASLQPGEVRDLGVISLNQGQSLTGTVRQSSAAGPLLGNIKVTAAPSFGAGDVLVQTYTDPAGRYTLWVSSFISNQYDVTAAPRNGNMASNGSIYSQVTRRNLSLTAATTADFLLEPLPASVTGQVVVEDASSGGVLSYPFGETKGFPAAAVNLQPKGVVPTRNPLGDIEATTDQQGVFSVPGLSTGTYSLRATSLGYNVFNATVTASTTSFVMYVGSNTPANYVPGKVITLRRGATVTGRILKSDGSAPNTSEVGGVAAANFASGEFVVGTIDSDKEAKTVNSYTISGFKSGISYNIVILPGEKGGNVVSPPEGSNVLFAASESTTTKSINLTYLSVGIDCVAKAKALGNRQFQLKIDCSQDLREQTSADDDLDLILTVSSGTGQFLGRDKSLSDDRKSLTAIYRAAAGETGFSIRLRAASSAVDSQTGENFTIDREFDFLTGLDSHVSDRISNINGGAIELTPSAQDESLGLDERSRIDLPPGAFSVGYDTDTVGGVAEATTTVNVEMSKGRDQQLAKTLSIAARGYAPASMEAADNPASFPREMWAAMYAYRTAASTTTVGGANPLSAFYSIFLPAGIRHQLKERADLTLSYSLAASSGTTDDKIQIWFYNAVLGRFVPETTDRRLDTVNKTITVSVDHFSTFVVLDSTPVATSTVSFGGADIAVANFPNPADCITHSNIARNSFLFGSGGVHAPFVGTMIRTSIPSGDTAALKINIYTVAGEKVRTIDQGELPAGQTYYTPWNCANDNGQTVASGVYIGEAVHGGRRKFFKIAIIKGSGL